MSAHTPGPWRPCHHLVVERCECGGRGPRAFISADDADLAICFLDEDGRGMEMGADDVRQPPREEARANAFLISASPDLLAACKEALKSIEAACAKPIGGPDGPRLVESYFCADMLRAAIKKATEAPERDKAADAAIAFMSAGRQSRDDSTPQNSGR